VSCNEVKAEKDVAFEVRLLDDHVHSFKVVSIFGNAVQRASNHGSWSNDIRAFGLCNRDDNTTTPLSTPRHRRLDILLEMEE
jgi:hypothetical protein